MPARHLPRRRSADSGRGPGLRCAARPRTSRAAGARPSRWDCRLLPPAWRGRSPLTATGAVVSVAGSAMSELSSPTDSTTSHTASAISPTIASSALTLRRGSLARSPSERPLPVPASSGVGAAGPSVTSVDYSQGRSARPQEPVEVHDRRAFGRRRVYHGSTETAGRGRASRPCSRSSSSTSGSAAYHGLVDGYPNSSESGDPGTRSPGPDSTKATFRTGSGSAATWPRSSRSSLSCGSAKSVSTFLDRDDRARRDERDGQGGRDTLAREQRPGADPSLEPLPERHPERESAEAEVEGDQRRERRPAFCTPAIVGLLDHEVRQDGERDQDRRQRRCRAMAASRDAGARARCRRPRPWRRAPPARPTTSRRRGSAIRREPSAQNHSALPTTSSVRVPRPAPGRVGPDQPDAELVAEKRERQRRRPRRRSAPAPAARARPESATEPASATARKTQKNIAAGW